MTLQPYPTPFVQAQWGFLACGEGEELVKEPLPDPYLDPLK